MAKPPSVELLPGKLDVRVSRGDTDGIAVLIKEDGAPADLSDRAFAAQLRRSSEAAEFVPIMVDTINAVDGVLVLRLNADTTEPLLGDYQWDLQQTIGGTVRTLLGGRWSFVPDVTKLP